MQIGVFRVGDLVFIVIAIVAENGEHVIEYFFETLFFDAVKLDVILLDYILLF
jgi:hypothetical protein